MQQGEKPKNFTLFVKSTSFGKVSRNARSPCATKGSNSQSPSSSMLFSKYVLADWERAPMDIALQS